MQHEQFMTKALGEAQTALDRGDFPVGCVITHGNSIVARGERRQSQQSSQHMASELDHAEIIALRQLLNDSP